MTTTAPTRESATERGARQVTRSVASHMAGLQQNAERSASEPAKTAAVRSMSDTDIAEYMEGRGLGRRRASQQATCLRVMTRGERPDPSLVDRCEMPSLADVRRQVTESLEQVLQGALRLRALSAGERVTVDDMVFVAALARRTVSEALDDSLPTSGRDLTSTLRRDVADGSDAWGDTFRSIAAGLVAGLLDSTAHRLAMRPETVVGAELMAEGMVA